MTADMIFLAALVVAVGGIASLTLLYLRLRGSTALIKRD